MSANLHDRDFFAWTQQQAELMRMGRVDQLDIEHLIDEIESMGASERKELLSRLEVLLMHLLKWQFQPDFRGRSWQLTIQEQRQRLIDHLDDNPSLKNPDAFSASIAKAYKYALIGAQRETGLSKATFPAECPYSVAGIFDESWYPD